MYIPRRHEENDPDTILDFVHLDSFAIPVSVPGGEPPASPVPLLPEAAGQVAEEMKKRKS